MDRFDITIIGGGVIGLAVAHALVHDRRFAESSIVILEQEDQFGQHISSRNSEVIHAGIYYPTDSLKARLCVRGKELLYDYCRQRHIAHRRCGKLIVAQDSEANALEDLSKRALANGVRDLQLLSKSELHRLEPAVAGDIALFSPSSGIIDSHGLMASLLHESEAAGVLFARRTRLVSVHKQSGDYLMQTQIAGDTGSEQYQFLSSSVINCAGLFARQVASLFDALDSRDDESSVPQNGTNIHYCKGDYFSYTGPVRLNHLVYPMPEANTVGLGIHATLDLAGQIRFGPDTEYVEALDYEVAASKAHLFARAIQRYLPSVQAQQLAPAYSGIRPKLSAAGEPPADFLVLTGSAAQCSDQIHLLGIESPGLTSSLAIGELVCQKLALQ